MFHVPSVIGLIEYKGGGWGAKIILIIMKQLIT